MLLLQPPQIIRQQQQPHERQVPMPQRHYQKILLILRIMC